MLKKRTENVSMNMHIEYEDIILLKYQNLKAFLRRERNFVFSIFQYRYNKNREVVYFMKSKQQDFRTEKYIRYGIRKYSLGVASVAI